MASNFAFGETLSSTALNTAINAKADDSFTLAGVATVRTVLDKQRDIVSVKDYGAVGDGAHDDTAAINAALAAVNGKQLIFPAPAVAYAISARLVIPATARDFQIIGTNALIQQNAANTPIFFFADETINNFLLTGFHFQWGDGSTPVSSAHTLSNCVVFGGTGVAGGGCFNFEISHLKNRNGRRVVTTDPAGSGTSTTGFWGGVIHSIFCEAQCVGSVIDNTNIAGGWPNVRVHNIYQHAGYCIEPMFNIAGGDTWAIAGFERNNAAEHVANTPQLIVCISCTNMSISQGRIENEHYIGNINFQALISLANTSASVRGIAFLSPAEFNVANYICLVQGFNNSSRRVAIDVDGLVVQNSNASPAFTAGSLYLTRILLGGGTNVLMNVGPNCRHSDYDGSVQVAFAADAGGDHIVFPDAMAVPSVKASATGTYASVLVSTLFGSMSAHVFSRPMSLVAIRIKSVTAGGAVAANITGANFSVFTQNNGVAITNGGCQLVAGASSASSILDPVFMPGGMGTGGQFGIGDVFTANIDTGGAALTSTTDIYVQFTFLPR